MPVTNLISSSLDPSKEKTLVLLSCSRDKRPGGKPYDSSTRSIARALSRTGQELSGKRRLIASMLRHDTSQQRLYDKDQKGGFRDERECNRNLKLGADFGGKETGGLYLPAHERYSGRFFSRLHSENPGFWQNLLNPGIDVLFVSGLYGLAYWNELIQDYDCHFNDYTSDAEPRAVAKIWLGSLTASLFELIGVYKSSSERIKVFDLLSEEAYQRVFDWNKVHGSGACVYHRVFKTIAGPDMLPALAVILAQEFPRFLARREFKRGEWYPLHTEESTVEYGFELPIGSAGLWPLTR